MNGFMGGGNGWLGSGSLEVIGRVGDNVQRTEASRQAEIFYRCLGTRVPRLETFNLSTFFYFFNRLCCRHGVKVTICGFVSCFAVVIERVHLLIDHSLMPRGGT